MTALTPSALSGDLDQLCLRVRGSIPEADYITVGRQLMGSEFVWEIRFHMPKRDRSFRLMRGRTEVVTADGSTFEGALEKAVSSAHYQRTGVLPG
jgi:hypothetical protein